MKICLLCTEIFAWGKYGGFGRATRIIGRELAIRGHEVSAVVPRRKGQADFEMLDGIKVFGFPIYNPLKAQALFKKNDADIYHSEEPSFLTCLAQKAMPEKKHVVTFRDPRLWKDWKIEYRGYSVSKLQVVCNYLFEDRLFVTRAVHKCHGRFCAARSLVPVAVKKYGLEDVPGFLPTPVRVPEYIEKSTIPLVCFVSRFNRRKRPEIFFELARKFPGVRFVAAGKALDRRRDAMLREKYRNISNLDMSGFLNQFDDTSIGEIYEKSWVLVNTASREGLPNAFIEAAANGCAILSHVNPDGFSQNYGYHVKDDNFEKGLRRLLADDRWRELGEKGRQYVEQHFKLEKKGMQLSFTGRKRNRRVEIIFSYK